jgi:hypothetical protein
MFLLVQELECVKLPYCTLGTNFKAAWRTVLQDYKHNFLPSSNTMRSSLYEIFRRTERPLRLVANFVHLVKIAHYNHILSGMLGHGAVLL